MSEQVKVTKISDSDGVKSTCEEYGLSQASFADLHDLSIAAKATAYCNYSHFRVGSVILTNDGTFISGANVENACYPVGVCAERVAFSKAITDGHRDFKAVAVSTDVVGTPTSPCGMCRQL
jgi:cytidine deaminase